jgi:hypothetical protein
VDRSEIPASALIPRVLVPFVVAALVGGAFIDC